MAMAGRAGPKSYLQLRRRPCVLRRLALIHCRRTTLSGMKAPPFALPMRRQLDPATTPEQVHIRPFGAKAVPDHTVSPATCANPSKTSFRGLRGSINRWTRAVNLLAAAVALLLVAPPRALSSEITTGSTSITLQPFFTVPSGAGAPMDLVSAGDGSGRLFVATRNGQILIADAAGDLAGTPFLDMVSAGVSVYTGGEGGLLGLAFSPFYSAPTDVPGSGKFYTLTAETFNATDPADFSHPELFPATVVNPNNEIVLREWSVSADPNLANTTSRVLLRIEHPQANHQGGALKFGPDNNLYIALGDGGGANDRNPPTSADGHTDNLGNAQDTTVVFGKILRIDPTGSDSANGQYGIPADNPFASSDTDVQEIFAYGLRNPFRISFDRSTGELLAGDVGQSQREEVDLITNGGNYGWVFREGTRDNAADSGRTLPSGFASIDPIAEYTHADGDAVIGGFVYRGSLIPDLNGRYVFGDLQGTTGTGRLFYMDAVGGTISEFQYDTMGGGTNPPSALYSFGEDADGELYALFANGEVLKLVPAPSSCGSSPCPYHPFCAGAGAP
jgi:glucose/arabinose dehydrogenase